jgi:hypothetical protein
MPYIIRPRQISKLAAGLLGSLMLAVAAPAFAQAACPTTVNSKAFEKFGDSASYTLVEGGLFESGTPNWQLRGAEVANESPEEENKTYEQVGYRYDGYYAGGYHTARGHSLAIWAGGEAVSPPFCVSAEFPSFRFLSRLHNSFLGVLRVGLRWSNSSGTHEISDASIQLSGKWTITPVLELASKLPEGTTPNVRLVFQPIYGSVAIDDIYIDPYSR